MSNFKSSYTDVLATLYWDIESLLLEYSDRAALLSPSAREAMWGKFEALRERFSVLKAQANEMLGQGAAADGHDAMVHSFLAELERLLDVEHEGDDWETYVGAAMIQAENRIYDEAHWVQRLA
ncbi:MAG TPA: hypothetical protein VFI92_07120 [Steroidobacteraceae bacterium]|nr:hypothetical protein [Steroidobacteraceae bacterium]